MFYILPVDSLLQKIRIQPTHPLYLSNTLLLLVPSYCCITSLGQISTRVCVHVRACVCVGVCARARACAHVCNMVDKCSQLSQMLGFDYIYILQLLALLLCLLA